MSRFCAATPHRIKVKEPVLFQFSSEVFSEVWFRIRGIGDGEELLLLDEPEAELLRSGKIFFSGLDI